MNPMVRPKKKRRCALMHLLRKILLLIRACWEKYHCVTLKLKHFYKNSYSEKKKPDFEAYEHFRCFSFREMFQFYDLNLFSNLSLFEICSSQEGIREGVQIGTVIYGCAFRKPTNCF